MRRVRNFAPDDTVLRERLKTIFMASNFQQLEQRVTEAVRQKFLKDGWAMTPDELKQAVALLWGDELVARIQEIASAPCGN
jgi:hypothetical protein